jgi:plastocyanin
MGSQLTLSPVTMAAAVLALFGALTQATACSERAAGPTSGPPHAGEPVAAPYRWPLSATVTLTADGAEPASVIINVGGRVTFVNNDVRPHEIVSDPYLRHDECPPINRVGFLVPGQQRESSVFEAVRTCGFHDHLDHTGLSGRIDVRID